MNERLDKTKVLSFKIEPITTASFPICAAIADAAFKTDVQTQFKAADPEKPYRHDEAMLAALNHWAQQPTDRTEMRLARDDDTGEILGWVVWGLRNLNDDPLIERKAKANAPPSLPSQRPQQIDRVLSLPTDGSTLEQHTSADLQQWMGFFMPPDAHTRCMFISSIAVHPLAQHRGVGSALIRYGTRKADEAGVFCWVHSSQSGYAAFLKEGFHTIGSLTIDLDVWNTDGRERPGGGEWGKYTYKYLKREAK